MTPHEHYEYAEYYLRLSLETQDRDEERFHLAAAQVHATLATVPAAEYAQREAAVGTAEGEQAGDS